MKIHSTYLEAPKQEIKGEKVCLYDACNEEYHFCHHPALGTFDGKIFAMWSNGKTGEDEIGQRVLYSYSDDGVNWAKPQVLCEPFEGEQTLTTLTAAGFHAYNGQLVAYVASYEYKHLEETKDKAGYGRIGHKNINTQLYALKTKDGKNFEKPQPLNLPICPNYGPRALRSGRLLLTGNWAHGYTDDPYGIDGWQMSGFTKDESLLEKPVRDDPGYFWGVSKAMNLPGAMCEGAFIEDENGAINMLHRSYGSVLFQSSSIDQAVHWSVPVETDFPNGNSKFWFGVLPDGRHAYIGNPEKDSARCPLVLSLSKDGRVFTTHYLLETQRVQRKFPGIYKGGIYGYPHGVVYQDALFVIYSVWKEDVVVQKIPLALLKENV